MLDGHEGRVRTLSKITKKAKISQKGKKKGFKIQKTHYLISAGTDLQIRLWKVPPRLPAMTRGWDGKQEEEYCLIAMKTKHEDLISSVLYMKDSIVTASKDKTIKIYKLQSSMATKANNTARS